MRKVKWNKEQIDAANPRSIVVSLYIGSDDIFTQSAEEIVQNIMDEHDFGMPNPTACEAIGRWLREASGNSFDIMAVENGEIVDLDRAPFFEGLQGN